MAVTPGLSADVPTAYSAVNVVLKRLLAEASALLGDQFIGMYLYGSLSSGDFDPDSSDIDFVCVTRGLLPDETVDSLATLHSDLWASRLDWADRLEGAYVPQDILRWAVPAAPPVPTLNEGRFYRAPLGSDWDIQRHIIREQGRVLSGPPPASLIDAVSLDALRTAVLGVLREWWLPMLAEPSWLRTAEYQAFAVLTMCRALYTLAHGQIASKPVSARWARQTLPDRFRATIEWAQAVKHIASSAGQAASDSRLQETMEMMRYTLGQAGLISGSPAPL